MEPWRYGGRWALVTGASAGIGRVFADRLAARGMSLVLTARREARLHELAEELRSRYDTRTAVIAADLARPGEATRLWTGATAGRPIDLLVNNAGLGARGRFDAVPLARHLEILQVDCGAVLELAHLALQDMRGRRAGGIINVSSMTAFQPVPLMASYAASKAFVLSLSEALWAENAGDGVRVLAVCPGRTPTEFQAIAGTGSAEGAFGFRAPEEVVETALRAFERGRSHAVPGVENLLASWLVRAVPRSYLTRAMKAVVKRVWRGEEAEPHAAVPPHRPGL